MTRIVFFGTPDYVLPVLDALKSAGHDIAAVVTQPPKPVGRKQILTPSPVAQWAKVNSVKVYDDSPKNLVEPLKSLGAQVAILEAYGRILPPELLATFPKGIINVHPSLLPRWRGASPVEAAIVAGDKITGVTIMKLDEEVDHGPILANLKEEVKENDTKIELRARLFDKAAELLVKVLPDYLAGKLELKEQDHLRATLTTLLKKDHGFIPPEYLAAALQGDPLQARWQIPFIKNYSLQPTPHALARVIRALDPWPGVWTEINVKRNTQNEKRRLKILKAHVESPTTHNSQPTLYLDVVQLEGKNPVSWKQFKAAYPEANF